MKKIPTIFLRDEQDRRYVTPYPNPDASWVLAGEGTATRKFDGTCVMLDADGAWWARREVKPGKTPPSGWVEVDHDFTTGKRMGWEPIEQSSFVKFMGEALAPATVEHSVGWRPGTYELCGPKINGNPERLTQSILIPHGAFRLADVPVDHDGLAAFLAAHLWEGIVWHHPDGRMAKIKRRDFIQA